MKISACYIVKDSAQDLARSLKSFAEFVDEIIVVDTGSADDTVAVAESFGAKIFHEAWADDFSAPRNLALSKVTGDWIVFLDADEFFVDDTAKNLRPAIERAKKFRQQGMLVHLVNVDADADNKILGTDYVMRIFKNLRGLHYVGKIHEELRPTLREITFAPPNLLLLGHTGYSASLNKTKAARNLKLLLDELAETKEPQRIYGYIAESYDGLGDAVNAEKFAVLDINSGTQSTRSYRIILKILSENPERLSERENFASMAVESFPLLPEFSAELAECFAARGDYLRAVAHMRNALKKFKTYRGIEPTTFTAEIERFAALRAKSWVDKL